MRILILTLGSRGDVQPFVALGAALRAVGHAVTLSAGRGFDELVAAHGLSSAPLSIDFREMIRSPEMQRANMEGGAAEARSFDHDVPRQLPPPVRAVLEPIDENDGSDPIGSGNGAAGAGRWGTAGGVRDFAAADRDPEWDV